MKFPAVFLDRDGTIIEDNGYIKDVSEVDVYSFTFESLKQLQTRYKLFIISNQSGIGKGLVTKEEVENINRYILDLYSKNGINIIEIYYCPHTDEDKCRCKKPNTFFIEKAAKDHQLDLSKSFIIGDHPSDILCGIKSGMIPIYVLTGHGEKHQKELIYKTLIFNNLEAAVKSIMTDKNN